MVNNFTIAVSELRMIVTWAKSFLAELVVYQLPWSSILEFELATDHKPLETIFKPTSKPPARIERWLLRLQAYRFQVMYKSGKENIADSISRLCDISSTKSFDWGGE